MCAQIGETYLTTTYKETRDLSAFLEELVSAALVGSPLSLGERPSGSPSTWPELAQQTPYTLAPSLYGSWDSETAVHTAICEQLRSGSDDE